MDYKMFFRKAFSDIREYHSCPDDVTIVNDILERAEKMKKDNNYETAYGSQAYEVQTSPVKPRKALSVFAGIAGTALLLTGAVFGLNWLNEHGILREGGIESSTGAGYSSNAGTTAADANDSGFDYIFQSFSIQRPLKTFDFDGFSVNIMKYEFDGKKFNLYYNVIYDEDFELSRSDRGMCLSIDHNNGIAGHGFDNTISETDREEDHVMSWELLIQDGRCTSYDMSFIPSYSRYKEYTVDEYTKLKEENKFNMTPNAENVVSALPIAEDMQAVVTTAVCITNPPVEATTVTAVLPDDAVTDFYNIGESYCAIGDYALHYTGYEFNTVLLRVYYDISRADGAALTDEDMKNAPACADNGYPYTVVGLHEVGSSDTVVKYVVDIIPDEPTHKLDVYFTAGTGELQLFTAQCDNSNYVFRLPCDVDGVDPRISELFISWSEVIIKYKSESGEIDSSELPPVEVYMKGDYPVAFADSKASFYDPENKVGYQFRGFAEPCDTSNIGRVYVGDVLVYEASDIQYPVTSQEQVAVTTTENAEHPVTTVATSINPGLLDQ